MQIANRKLQSENGLLQFAICNLQFAITMRYIPHTKDEIQSMLKEIGVDSVSNLFDSIPDDVRLKSELPIPTQMHEEQVLQTLKEMADANINMSEGASFIGAGAYYHTIPSVINYLVKRGEFLTTYTPYQPEVSQGTLQAIYEFQTMICELTGMEVANASQYDLSTACAEALQMARRVTKKNKALVARSVHPHYRQVCETYFKNQDFEIIEIPYDEKTGQIDQAALDNHISDDIAAVLVQSPNFFGVIEELKIIGDKLQDQKPLFIAACAEPLSYAVLQTPGEAGADIAIGEGMSFGLGANYGGPYLGLFATKQKYLRSLPGRLVGETVDSQDHKGYVLTLSTREQHIRREKATSNICTNQGLCALTAAVYLSLMGPQGLKNLALLNLKRRQLLDDSLAELSESAVHFTGPKFNESVVKLALPAKDAVVSLLKDKLFAGLDVSNYYPELNRHLLVCTTEMNQVNDISVLTERLSKFL